MNTPKTRTHGLEPGAISGCYAHPVPEGSRRIAWDAVSFCVPSNWEMALYKFLRRGITRIELEDEYSIRLEAEWTRARKGLDLERIMARYTEAARPLTIKAEIKREIKSMPRGWHASHFIFRETESQDGDRLEVTPHELVTCFYLCPQSSIFCFFLLHFFPEEPHDAAAMTRRLAERFEDHACAHDVPWQLFDIGFKMPRDYRLVQTQFGIGMQLMVFAWRMRHYFLWHLSCADMFLNKGDSPAEWVCAHLNASKVLKAPVFYPDGKGGIAWRRRLPYVFGHREEIARWCYQYDVGYRLDEERNQLVVWVYHHRHHHDMHSRFAISR